MKNLFLIGFAIFIFIAAQSAAAQTTVFTFQGKLTDQGNPANGAFQMQFKMFDALAGGSQIGSTVSDVSVMVTQGIFTTQLDFGASAFPGADRFLEIAVRRNSSETFTILSPRQQIASSPYAIKAISAQQADTALDAQKLGGVNASEYVTTTSVGNSFIKNATTQQTANFNISGNGFFGGSVGIGTTSPSARLTVSGSGLFNAPNAARFDLFNTVLGGGFLQHVLDNGTWQLATTGGATRMVVDSTGSVGLGTGSPSPFFRLDVVGHGGVRSLSNSASHFVAETAGGTNSWARFYMRSPNRSWFIGTSQAFNGDQFYLVDETANQTRMAIATNGNIGFGTTTPNTRLTLNGGVPWTSNGWTASMNMQNGSTLGWEANASGQRFGIGQTGGGLYFFRTNSAYGNTTNPANYDMVINDAGNIQQPVSGYGLPKAMVYVNGDGTILRCYNGITGSSTGGCGFSSSRFASGYYAINFGFPMNNRFLSVTLENCPGCNSTPVGISYTSSGQEMLVHVFETHESGIPYDETDRPFMVIVY